MSVHLDDSELRALAAALRKAGPKAGRDAGQVIRRAGQAIEARAKAGSPVDTGALRSSISTSTFTSPTLSSTEVGPTVNYGVYVELGTSVQPGQPYLTPAFDLELPGVLAALSQVATRSF